MAPAEIDAEPADRRRDWAELADCYRVVEPFLLAMPLDGFPDHHERIAHAPRHP